MSDDRIVSAARVDDDAQYEAGLRPRLLDEYKIDATLLVADAPGPQILDHLKGWKRIYADGIAVIHVRENADGAAAPAK